MKLFKQTTTKTQLTYDPTIPLVGIDPTRMKSVSKEISAYAC